MRFTLKATLLAVGLVAVAGPAQAAFVQYGTTGQGGNAFPFGGNTATGTRYQQVYDNALLPAGSISINTITFFAQAGASFRAGQYDFYLSTSNNPVNGLDTTNLNSNPGGNALLVGSYNLGGPAVIGSVPFAITPYTFNTASGDLLLDIRYTGTAPGTFVGFFDAMNGTFGNDSSRAHNYGLAFESYGLVTRFDFTPAAPNAVPAPAGLLLGLIGLPALGVAGRLRRRAAVQA